MRRRFALLLPARRMAQVQVAMMLLTRLPAGQLTMGAGVPKLAQAAWAFPVAGLVIGAIGGAVLLLGAALGLPSDVAAALAVAAGVLVTGGLHEDGLADVADGFGGGRDLAQKLVIMRDSRIGSYGTLALIFAIGLRVLCLGQLAQLGAGLAAVVLLGVECASRAGLAVMLRALPAARGDGLGQSAAGVTRTSAGVALILGAGGLAVAGLAVAGLSVASLAMPAGALAVTPMSAGAGIALGGALALGQGAVAALALRQIGGQTGDVLGAAQQIGALAALLAAVAMAG